MQTNSKGSDLLGALKGWNTADRVLVIAHYSFYQDNNKPLPIQTNLYQFRPHIITVIMEMNNELETIIPLAEYLVSQVRL